MITQFGQLHFSRKLQWFLKKWTTTTANNKFLLTVVCFFVSIVPNSFFFFSFFISIQEMLKLSHIPYKHDHQILNYFIWFSKLSWTKFVKFVFDLYHVANMMFWPIHGKRTKHSGWWWWWYDKRIVFYFSSFSSGVNATILCYHIHCNYNFINNFKRCIFYMYVHASNVSAESEHSLSIVSLVSVPWLLLLIFNYYYYYHYLRTVHIFIVHMCIDLVVSLLSMPMCPHCNVWFLLKNYLRLLFLLFLLS